jgi:hypothetical protein
LRLARYCPAQQDEDLFAQFHCALTICTDIAGTVASMTENDPGVESEKASHNIPGEPGQRHEAGKAFACSV